MGRFVLLIGVLLLPLTTSFGQILEVGDAEPVDGSAGAALETTVRLTFNHAVDPAIVYGDLIDVYPPVEVRAMRASEDGRTVSFDVVHLPETDYLWVLSGAYAHDGFGTVMPGRPFLLRYTTRAVLGGRRVSGRVGSEGSADGAIVGLSTSRLVASGSEWAAAAVVDGATGTFSIAHVRDGTYWPVVVRHNAAPTFPVNPGWKNAEIGFLDADGDGVPDSLRVDGGDVEGIELALLPYEVFATTAGAGIARATHLARSRAEDNVLVAMKGTTGTTAGRTVAWDYDFHSAARGERTTVSGLLFDVSIETGVYDGPVDPAALPEAFVDTDRALRVALDNGGRAFVDEHPAALAGFAAGVSASTRGLEGPVAADPYWWVYFVDGTTTPGTVMVAFVDMQTAAFLGSITPRAPVTAYRLLERARQHAAPIAANARIVRLEGFGIGMDGRSSAWTYLFHVPGPDTLFEVAFDAMGGTTVTGRGSAGGVAPHELREPFFDTDAAMTAVFEAGGADFITTYPAPYITLSGGVDAARYPAYAERQIYAVTLDGTGEGRAERLTVLLDLIDGTLLATERAATTTGQAPAPDIPQQASLGQNYPNPFNPSTTIPFHLEQPGPVRLSIHDLVGREVAVLVDGIFPQGAHTVSWQARDVAGGVYVYRLRAGDVSRARLLVLQK